MLPAHGHVPESCRVVSGVLERIGDKWSVLVVMLLGDGPRRFNELRREVGGISQRMLSLTLKRLERDGLLTRTVHPGASPQVEYALTELGRSLWGPIQTLGDWARENQPSIDAARRRFDGRKAAPGVEESDSDPAGARPGGGGARPSSLRL